MPNELQLFSVYLPYIYHDRWWKQLNVETNLSFIRDRIVECHFWMTGACFEQQYSLSRVIATKMTAIITILDDIMDTYSTTEEAMLIAEAIYRYCEPPLHSNDLVTSSCHECIFL